MRLKASGFGFGEKLLRFKASAFGFEVWLLRFKASGFGFEVWGVLRRKKTNRGRAAALRKCMFFGKNKCVENGPG